MIPFLPTRIYIDLAVAESPVTQRVLDKFPAVPKELISSSDMLKNPMNMTDAKKVLFLTESKGASIKACQGGGGDYVCCDYFTISLTSNCHFECTYCILQDYLSNNPVISIFTNIDEILSGTQVKLKEKPDSVFRIGTGELADSLGLDPITEYSKDLVAFAARNKNMILELKTKSTFIDNLEGLDHQGRVVVGVVGKSPVYIDKEEFKTAPLLARIQAARQVANWGYKVAFHLDPLMHFDNWQHEYSSLVDLLKNNFNDEEIAWISLGSLRYTKGLGRVMKERWPKSELLFGELFPTEDGKVRYFRGIREEMYALVKSRVDAAFPGVANYLCMETAKLWEKVFKFVPQTTHEVEQGILEKFHC